MNFERTFGALSAALLMATVSTVALAADKHHGWTTATPGAARPNAEGLNVSASETYNNAHAVANGIALRNRGGGAFIMTGVTGPVKAAWIYWAVITQGAPKTKNKSVTLARFFPSPSSPVKITGTAIGTGPSPCWSGDTTTVFRGSVPTDLFSSGGGNGLFALILPAGASGLTDNSDPFVNSPLPEMEGATLVVVGAGSGKVALYDQNLAGHEFESASGFSYGLNLTTNSSSSSQVLFTEIGADGQVFADDTFDPGMATKTTSINGHPVAGFNAPDLIPDWDGVAGVPIPQLWDTSTHDITSVASGTSLGVDIEGATTENGGSDCLVTVANIVEIVRPQNADK